MVVLGRATSTSADLLPCAHLKRDPYKTCDPYMKSILLLSEHGEGDGGCCAARGGVFVVLGLLNRKTEARLPLCDIPY